LPIPKRSEKGCSLRFNHIVPAVALCATTSSAIPVLAHAAPSVTTVPHSASRADVHAATVQRTKVADPGVPQSTATTQGNSNTGVNEAKKSDATEGTSSVRSSIRLAVKMLLGALNTVRTAKRLPPLSLDRRESKCSRLHSQHMALNGQISHDQFPTDVCVPYRFAAENVGADPGLPPDAVLSLHRLMMNEGPCTPGACTGATFEQHGHYMNILSPLYRHIGIGIVVRHGTTWLTEDFTS
jgi:uncharacterized protein YkwD